MHGHESGSFPPQRDFRTIHLEDPWIATRRAQPGRDPRPRQEAEFHQALRIIARQIDSIEDSRVAPTQINQGCGKNFRLAAVDTQLHLGFSMLRSEIVVNSPNRFLAPFLSHPLAFASKCTKIKDNRMLPRIGVRKIRLADLDRIQQIEDASFGEHAYDRNLIAELYRKCGDLFLVAERRSGVCGYIVTCIRGDRAEIVSIAVDPASRGKGAASALMDSTLRRLRRRKVARLVLIVKLTNAPARRFYERYHFHKVRIVRGYYEDGSDGLLMSRAVQSQEA